MTTGHGATSGRSARAYGRLVRAYGRHWPVIGLAAVGALGVAAHIADELLEGESFKLDTRIILALREPGRLDVPIGPAWLQQSAIDVSALGGFTLMWLFGATGIGALIYLKRRGEAVLLALSLVGASALNSLLKVLIHRTRPDLVPHLAQAVGASFPSGHAMISAAVYLTLGALAAQSLPRPWPRTFVVGFAVFIVVLIGCSRVYLGVHWPSDVLAGWCFGAVWALIALTLDRAFFRPRP